MNIKTKIVKNWDKDYGELGGEKFNAEWLDDPFKATQLLAFLSMMNGHIQDGTHNLEGDDRAKKIDEIQIAKKDDLWERSRQQAANTPYTTEDVLKHIKRLTDEIVKYKSDI